MVPGSCWGCMGPSFCPRTTRQCRVLATEGVQKFKKSSAAGFWRVVQIKYLNRIKNACSDRGFGSGILLGIYGAVFLAPVRTMSFGRYFGTCRKLYVNFQAPVEIIFRSTFIAADDFRHLLTPPVVITGISCII